MMRPELDQIQRAWLDFIEETIERMMDDLYTFYKLRDDLYGFLDTSGVNTR